MVILKFGYQLDRVTLETKSGTQYYSPYRTTRWKELTTLLSMYDITFTSLYEMNLDNDAYKFEGVPKLLCGRDVNVWFKDNLIAEASVDGSNVCDSSARLKIYLYVLEDAYKEE